MKTIEKIIQTAIEFNYLDDAIYNIQKSLGITDGFNASIYFSDLEDYDWRIANEWNRANILREYIQYEINDLSFNYL